MPTAPTHLLVNLPGPEDLDLETIRAAHPPARVVAAADLLDLRRSSQQDIKAFIFSAKRQTTRAVTCLDCFIRLFYGQGNQRL